MKINDDILSVKDKILETVDNCEKIILFGSYAYGTPTEKSDYDFYVVLNDNDKNPIIVMGEIYWTLAQSPIKVQVDILANYKNRFEIRSKMPTIERTIADKGVILYNNT